MTQVTLFTTQERGNAMDYEPNYYMAMTGSVATPITRQQYITLIDENPGGEWVEGDYTFTLTPQDAPKTHGTKKVVHVQHLDGTTETDAQFWARQAELADYAATMDAASYRGQ